MILENFAVFGTSPGESTNPVPCSFTPMLLNPEFEASATVEATFAPMVNSAEMFPCCDLNETFSEPSGCDSSSVTSNNSPGWSPAVPTVMAIRTAAPSAVSTQG